MDTQRRRERLRVAAAVAAVAAVAALLSGAPRAQATLDPYAVFDRARTFWLDQTYPPYLAYDVAVTVDENGVSRTERYDSGFNAVDGSIWVDPVSDYERAHPHVVHGMNFFLALPLDPHAVRLNKPEEPVDFIGVPILAPTYTFGMAPFVPARPPATQEDAAVLVAAVRRAFHDPYPAGRTPPPNASSQLPTIAHAVVTKRIYQIELAGEESVDGHLCYHLTLRPLHDPGRYRLRQLWVDEQTAATWRLQEALNFVDGPGTTVPWTVDFTNVGGAHYIAQESADAPMRYGGVQYVHASVAFEDVRAVTSPQGNAVSFPPQRDTLEEP